MRFGDIVDRAKMGELMAMRTSQSGMVTFTKDGMTYSDSYGDVEYMADFDDVMAEDWEMVSWVLPTPPEGQT